MYQKRQTLALASPFSHIPSHPLFVSSYISLSVSQMKHFFLLSLSVSFETKIKRSTEETQR
jgi:hypothetical protein